MSLLDWICEHHTEEIRSALEQAPNESLDACIEGLATSFTRIAQAAGAEALIQARTDSVPEQSASRIADVLRRHLPEESDERLQGLGDLLVWSADGVLGGALARPDLSLEEARQGLVAAWRGIVSGWPRTALTHRSGADLVGAPIFFSTAFSRPRGRG
jgi:hypothetical protein